MSFKEHKNKNQEIYFEVLDLMNNDSYLKESIKESKQYYYDDVPFKIDKCDKFKTEVLVLDDDITNVIINNKNDKMCVMDFSSGLLSSQKNIGSRDSYEDALFRSTTLSKCLDNSYCVRNYYLNNKKSNLPILTDRILYIKDSVVFRNDLLNKYLLKKDWFNIDFVLATPPDLTKYEIKPTNVINALKKRIFNVFSIMAKNNIKVVVLGAFGCGKAENSPSLVSSIFKDTIEYFDGCFERIIFAIKGNSNENRNYEIFKKNLIG